MPAPEGAPRAPFAPPVSDPSVLAILNGLNPSVTPKPLEIASTDGEMSASFAAGPRRAPVAEETPAGEASVVVKASVSTPPGAKKQASRDRVDTTFRLRPKRYSLGLPVAVAVLLGGVVIAAWLGRTTATEQSVKSAATASASRQIAPAVPVVAAPAVPNIPPPEPAPSVEEGPVAGPVVAPAKAIPAVSTVKPAPRTPSRPKDDEPARVR